MSALDRNSLTVEQLNELLQRVRQGDQLAATDLVALFHEDVLRLIRARMRSPRNRLLCRRIDAEDVEQLSWIAFFGRALVDIIHFGHLPAFNAFVHHIAANELSTLRRFHLDSKKRSLLVEVPLDRPDLLAG